MTKSAEKIRAFVCGAVLLYVVYYVSNPQAREAAIQAAKPFECELLYELPQVWRCGAQSDYTPTFNVDMYVTANSITLTN